MTASLIHQKKKRKKKKSTNSPPSGTRSVSTLTPSQLARKRANDREAQRAIRARTKEHIERLERELEELKGQHSRDKTVQDLLRRNKALEDELSRLRQDMGIVNSSPYSAPAGTTPQRIQSRQVSKLTSSAVYEDNLSAGSGAIPSPRMSPLAPTSDYNSMPEYGQQQQQQQQHYVPMPNNCEAWAATVPNAVNSAVSSPASSGHNDEYVAAYIPTSVPTSMMPTSNSMHAMDNKQVKLEFDMQGMQGMPAGNNYMEHQNQQNTEAWQMYNMYYPSGMPKANDFNNACLSR